jgi:hypothetical protein
MARLGAEANRILRPRGEEWWVHHRYEDHEQVEDAPEMFWSEDDHCFVDRGERCEWMMEFGEEVLPGTDRDRELNWWKYEGEF